MFVFLTSALIFTGRPSTDPSPHLLSPSFTRGSIPTRLSDPMLTNVNNNNSNDADKMDQAVLETIRLNGDAPDTNHVMPAHAMDYHSGEQHNASLLSRAAYYAQPRRMVLSQPVFPGQGRHFSWYKPTQPCLPSVGEEEVERTQLRASPLLEEVPHLVGDSFIDLTNGDNVTSYPVEVNDEARSFPVSPSPPTKAPYQEGISHSDPTSLNQSSNGKNKDCCV